jgi:hypothetical protein
VDSQETIAPSPEHSERAYALVRAEAQFSSGVNWFLWILGLTVVNGVAMALGSEWGLSVGLTVAGFAQAGVAFAISEGFFWLLVIAVPMLVLPFLVLAGLWWLAKRGSVIAFAGGIGCYAVDGLLAAALEQWITVAIHGLALWGLWSGLSALRRLRRDFADLWRPA